MNEYLVLAAVAWLIAIPLILAVWFSPRALLRIKRRLVARADGLTASRAAYKAAHWAAMDGGTKRLNMRYEDDSIVTVEGE